MKALYYGLCNLFLLLPDAVRILAGVLAVALCFNWLWPIEKYIYAALVQICRGISFCILGGARCVLPNIFSRNGKELDEKIRRLGKGNNLVLQRKCKKIMRSTNNLLMHSKHTWKVWALIAIWALLPLFPLEEYISHNTLTKMYGLNHFIVNTEKRLTQGIENYPPFWIEDNTSQAFAETEAESESETESEENAEDTAQPPVYLKLNSATYYAYVREAADLKSNSIQIVSQDDVLLYEHIYEYDSERFWLKVSLPDYGLEGWISERVIDAEIVDTLNLQ